MLKYIELRVKRLLISKAMSKEDKDYVTLCYEQFLKEHPFDATVKMEAVLRLAEARVKEGNKGLQAEIPYSSEVSEHLHVQHLSKTLKEIGLTESNMYPFATHVSVVFVKPRHGDQDLFEKRIHDWLESVNGVLVLL